jgi:hypothetical protein
MRYSKLRPRIKTGDLIVWAHRGNLRSRKGFETWLTRTAQQAPWTHVGVAWVEHGRVWVMDLTTRGCAPRLLSGDLPAYWIAAPRALGEPALHYAFSRFGELVYSRWQAVLGFLGLLRIGADLQGECAEYVLEIYRTEGIAPTDVATPAALVEAALAVWGRELVKVEQ